MKPISGGISFLLVHIFTLKIRCDYGIINTPINKNLQS